MRSGVFTFIQGGNLKKVPNQSLNKGDHFTIMWFNYFLWLYIIVLTYSGNLFTRNNSSNV